MRFVSSLLCAILLCTTTETSAQENKKPSKAEIAYAKELFGEANEAYQLQEWDKALAKFQEAYRLSQKPELLFNISQCYQKKLQYAEAIQSLNAFINEAPKSPYREEAERLIQELTWLQQKQEDLKKEEALAAEKKAADTKQQRKKKLKHQVFYGAVISTAAAGGVGEVLALKGVRDLEAAGNIDADATAQQLKKVQRTAIISDVTIAASLIAGGAGFILQKRRQKQSSEQDIALSLMFSQGALISVDF